MNHDEDAAPTLTVIDRDSSSSDSGESLQIYMKQIQKLPLLKRDEEIVLARTIKNSKSVVIELFCEAPDFFAELYLIKDLSLTEQKKLFFSMLDEDSEKVSKKIEELDFLLNASVKAQKASDKLLNLLKQMNFTPQQLKRWITVVADYGNEAQLKKLKTELVLYKRAKDKMATSNLRLVFSRAKSYLNKGLSLEDLLQEGNIGLMRAIDKYDVEKGFKFGTYATWWIDQALGRAVADKGRIIRIPVHMVENINRISKATRTLTSKLGRNPSMDELSAASDLSEEKIKKVNKLATFPQSVEEPQGDQGVPLSEFLVDLETPDPSLVIEQKEAAEKVRYLLSKLTPREEKILRMRFGIGEKRPQLLDSIGEANSISTERARQIVESSLKKVTKMALEENFETNWAHDKRNPPQGV